PLIGWRRRDADLGPGLLGDSHGATPAYASPISPRFRQCKFGVNSALRTSHVARRTPHAARRTAHRGPRTADYVAAPSASARNAPICRRSSSWITSTLRRASRTRKLNSSAIDAYSFSSERWYARKLS